MNDTIAFAAGLFDNGLDAVAVFDDNLCATHWNAPMVELSNIPRERAIGQSLRELFPAAASVAARQLREVLAGNCRAPATPFFAAPDPAAAQACVWFAMPLLERGRIVGCGIVARQLAGRDDLRTHLREVEHRFRSMADNSPVLLWMSGTDSLCNFFNQTWLEFTGRTLQQELGVGWAEGIHAEDFRRSMDIYMDAFSARRAFEMEYRLRRRDGAYRWILDRGAPRYLDNGAFAGFIGSCVDITERREAEQRTRDTAADLARANLYMEQLLYAASHDLREPIRMVGAFLDLLRQHLADRLDAQAREYIDFADEGAQRMKALVNGLLDLSQTRVRAPALCEVAVADIVAEAVRDLNGLIRECGATIECGELPSVQADPALLRSLLHNLLGNAIKFRGERPPRIAVGARRNADEWIFSVRDNGIGFEPEYAEAVFETFRRLHNRETYPGNGLGLALAREIVIRHGGRTWAKGIPGEGAEFFFTLPVRKP